MALTVTPVAGELIAAAWGAEVRDRTIQVFATTAERDTWAAPNGAFAVVTSNGYVYQRMAGVWRPFETPTWAGTASAVSNSSGTVALPHGLGVTPLWAIVQKRGPTSWTFDWVSAVSPTTVSVLCKFFDGNIIPNATMSTYLQVGL